MIFLYSLSVEESSDRYDTSACSDADADTQEYDHEVIAQIACRDHICRKDPRQVFTYEFDNILIDQVCQNCREH